MAPALPPSSESNSSETRFDGPAGFADQDTPDREEDKDEDKDKKDDDDDTPGESLQLVFGIILMK
jgi:hypothetical protein